MAFVKLSNLQKFQITGIGEHVWKFWNTDTKKMEKSVSYRDGYREVHTIETDQGTLDLSNAQLSQCLLECMDKFGESKIVGRHFSVKTNGKSGLDIRYWLNALPLENAPKQAPEAPDAISDQEVAF